MISALRFWFGALLDGLNGLRQLAFARMKRLGKATGSAASFSEHSVLREEINLTQRNAGRMQKEVRVLQPCVLVQFASCSEVVRLICLHV